jgi:hypothetical protein
LLDRSIVILITVLQGSLAGGGRRGETKQGLEVASNFKPLFYFLICQRHPRASGDLQYVLRYNPPFSVRISTKNFGFENNIKSVPVYAVFCI